MAEVVINALMSLGIDVLFDILDALLALLPLAPFRAMINSIGEIDTLKYVNYFIPFGTCAKLIDAWLVCVLAYYVYKYLRQIIETYIASHK